MDGLTPYSLQCELIDVIKEVVKGLYFEDNKGKKVPVGVYPQDLPPKVNDDMSEPIPYVIVRIISGKSPLDWRTIAGEDMRVIILVGVRNSDTKSSAYIDLMGVIQKIKYRLQIKPVLIHFTLNSDIEWVIDDESPWPYAFGGLDMRWKGQTIMREDKLT